MEQSRHVPDSKGKLEVCYIAVIEAAHRHKKLKGNSLVIGGKSMGGRIASQVAAQVSDDALPNGQATAPILGLVLLGYPLHPPGNPEKLRDAHLSQIKAPMLIVQGSRDAFGTAEELRAVIKKHRLPATLHIIEGGDHSFKVPKSSGVPQTQVYENVMDEIARWTRLVVLP
jgi:predicted alpha/beta-hydrolase family hydrolase